MVRVWYEPPPFGPATDLNRSGYGVHGGGLGFRMYLERLERLPKVVGIGVPTLIICMICYIPLMNQKLPFSMDPEYQAAQRAYMRYHNMNPIFGISSKKARATDPDP
jgi:hypothetical protein